ncbi:K, P-type ATPase [Tilletiaria anomala UBC 951]|uniref:K, P-type ATPase n=1 Tax=Tilletiaria anomala (strain ATCC 24038 / CBS 436.72 / UBC 951) TaxID=1037660 RepID=A0A066VNP0_TILAU|nr:K, P-type ATPase [Tilletiaria anomala UBC 951]KDN43106.1 K, P-type ATPase [Tilletiaria anomala UBC 951]
MRSTAGGGLQRSTTRASQHAAIPIGFRTLSIQVEETQDAQRRKFAAVSAKQGKRKDAEPGAADAEYFSTLDYHTLPAKQVYDGLNVHPDHGLDGAAVSRRLQRDGPNTLVAKRPNYLIKLAKYVFGGFCSILWVGVVIFFISWRPLGDPNPQAYNLALAILVILVIILQAIFNAGQDWSTARVMNSIKSLLPADAVVIRDGQKQTIKASELVAGDLVVLTQGVRVPADIRLLAVSDDLSFDRAILTGESEEVAGTVETDEKSFLEAKNIAFLGSHVASGSGTGVVVLTGPRSVMGRINKLTNTGVTKKTSLQREIDRFVLIIIGLTVTLVIIMLVFWLAYLRREHAGFLNVVGILTNLMSLVVAFIPEGMPIGVALTLSLIARRMRDQRVLPKSLSTVETLGCITMLLSDKTGTLTENKMTVTTIYCGGEMFDASLPADDAHKSSAAYASFERAMVLCNDAFFETKAGDEGDEEEKAEAAIVVAKGNATDCAVLYYASQSADYDRIAERYERRFQIPFNSKNKFMMTAHVDASVADVSKRGQTVVLFKGAPDILLAKCAVPDDVRQAIEAAQESMSAQGQRVILLAEKPATDDSWPSEQDTAALRDLVFLGLIGIVDPPRSDIPHTVSEVRRAGCRFAMVTGDFVTTATAIARQCGIVTTTSVSRLASIPADVDVDAPGGFELPHALTIEGKEIPAITQAQWDVITRVEELVFARTTPEQKLAILREFKDREYIVAMTGDGTNDSPALKAADVGIAILGGSDVAIEAADLVLMGDFSSIIPAMRQGRVCFQNLQKVIVYLLPAGSWSEDWPVVFNVFFGVPLALSSFLMIIICCFTDLASCLTLIMEQEEFDLLSLPPRSRKDHLVNLAIYGQAYFFIGTMFTLCAHSMFFLYMWQEARIPPHALFFAYEKYGDGFYGYTADQLTAFNATGQCCYFVCLVIMQMFHLLSVRNKKLSILQADPIRPARRNLWIFLGIFISLGIAIFVVEVPGIQTLFGTASIPIRFWLMPIPLGLGVLIVDEVRKLLVRTFPKGPIARIAW